MASTKLAAHDKDTMNNSGVITVGTWHAEGTFTQNKVVPHVQAGAEWYMCKWLALDAGVKYESTYKNCVNRFHINYP